jgi:hypothetical protein
MLEITVLKYKVLGVLLWIARKFRHRKNILYMKYTKKHMNSVREFYISEAKKIKFCLSKKQLSNAKR